MGSGDDPPAMINAAVDLIACDGVVCGASIRAMLAIFLRKLTSRTDKFPTKTYSIPQQRKLFTWDLQSALGMTLLQ